MSRYANPSTTRVGWIGCGVMGQRMASHIIKKGYSMTVYNRTACKCKSLEELGAVVVNTPKEVAERSDVVISIVGYPKDVREVALNETTGVLAGLKKGGIYIDMTTSEPGLAQEIETIGLSKEIECLDAPCSGGDTGALNGTLAIFCGGKQEAFNDMLPLFELMGKQEAIHHTGDSGTGQHTKLCNQVVIAGNLAGLCEGLLYAKTAGLDVEKTLSAISGGAAQSWGLVNMGPRVIQRHFSPNFYANHFAKDLKCALDESNNFPLSLPSASHVHSMLRALQAQGDGDTGIHGLYLALERLNGSTDEDYTKDPEDVFVMPQYMKR